MSLSLSKSSTHNSQRSNTENGQYIDLVLSHRYLLLPTSVTYEAAMKKHGLQPETVALPHNTEGYWIGNKNAKNVIVYYHGACPMSIV